MRHETRSIAALIAMGLWFMGIPLIAGGEQALDRLHGAIVSCWSEDPGFAAEVADLSGQAAEDRASVLTDAPFFEIQREGIGSGFDDRPNAAQYLRVGRAFLPPWRLTAARSFQAEKNAQLDASLAWVRYKTAGEVARVWLNLAATKQALEIAERRLERLEKAVALQEKRFELGELAGTEVTQLRMELGLERSQQAQLGILEDALTANLERLAVARDDFPELGDLGQVANALRIPLPDLEACTAQAQDSLQVQMAKRNAQAARQLSRLTHATAWGLPEAEIEWESIPDLEGAPGFDGYGVRISVPIPIGKAGKERRVGARLAAESAESAARRAEQTWIAAVKRQHAEITRTRKGLTDLAPLVAGMPDVEHALSEQIRLGAIETVSYIDGMSRLDDVQRAYVDAQLAMALAQLDLSMTLGGSPVFPLPEFGLEENR